MRADEIQPSKLVVFDIDDTLVHTQTQVHVIRNGAVVKSLNSHDFTLYRLQPGEEFDFADFRNAQEFFEKSRPIIPMMNQLKHDIATGNRVVMVTARADFDDKELFLDTFRKYGVDMSRVHVYRAGNMQGATTEEKKKKIIRDLLDQGSYTKAIMYDDAVPNLNSFMELKQEYPDTRFYAWHVDPEGRAREFARESVAEAKTVHYNGIDISIETQDDIEGYIADPDDEPLIYVIARSDGQELGHVLFSFDGEYLTPEDLEVDDRCRGQGIAATMYDYMKNQGYKIRRNPSQTAAGAGFWNKHKPSKNIWEQQKKELVKEVNDADELEVSERIQDYFFSKGYKYVGEGRDQIVFKSPRNTIVKVLGVGDGDREQAVRDYVEFFQRNQRNPHYPRIYNSGDFQLGEETYFVYETEYLEYVASEEATLEYIEDLMTAMARGQLGVNAFMMNKPRPSGISEQELDGLIYATEAIIEGLVGPKGYNLDLGQIENIRRRANGQLVIVDPISIY